MSNIILEKTINDIKIFNYQKFEDERGFFSEIFVDDLITSILPNFKIAQINFSNSKLNIARGLHLQTNPPMGKMMRLVKGKAVFFAFDCRLNNSISSKIEYFEIDEDSNKLIWAPYYYARGFISLSDETLVEYLCTERYNQKGEYAINLFDKNLDHPYKKNRYQQSEKDKIAMTVKEWFSLNFEL